MKIGSRKAVLGAIGAAILCLAGMAPASAQSNAASSQAKPASTQAGAAEKPLLAEDVFKDIRVLRGMPLDEFMDTMGFFAASLAMTCTDCHVSASGGSWDRYQDETPLMATARKMVLMMSAINKDNFGGSRSVTCFTCHRDDAGSPKVVPSLMLQYGTPVEDPNEATPGVGAPTKLSADQVFDKYIQAIGGAQKLAGLTSFVVKGTYDGWDTGHEKRPLEVYAKAPAQRTTIVHMRMDGDKIWTYDGRQAWIASPDKPVPLMTLTGGELDGARFDATLSFPAQIRKAFPTWRVGTTAIDDRDAILVQGSAPGHASVKLYFDKESGLLLRQVRYTTTNIGTIPLQIDYSDYRLVAGVKLPFHWVTTWTDGQSVTEVSAVQPNVAIDPAILAKPAPAKPPAVAEAR